MPRTKRQLECLRLASELQYLARETPDADLKAWLLRSAAMWTDPGASERPCKTPRDLDADSGPGE